MNYRIICSIQMVLFLVLMVFSSVSAVEITDATNDIWLQEKNSQSNEWVWVANNLSNYSYIDVTDIQYTSDEDFELTINFLEPFEFNKTVSIVIFYGDYETQNQYYRFRYTAETNLVQMTSKDTSSMVNRFLGIDFANNNTQMRFNTTFVLDDDGFSIWGYADEYSFDYNKYWIDFFPSSYDPTDVDFDDTSDDQDQDDDVDDSDDDQQQNETDNDDSQNGGQNTDDDNTTDDTPGFELLLLCLSMMLILFYRVKRKH